MSPIGVTRQAAVHMQHTNHPHDSGRRFSKPADLLLINAKAVTLEPGIPVADAVAVSGETILAVGKGEDVAKLAGPGSRWIDCRGLALIPGLIDAHLHLLALAAARHGLDCSPQAVSSIPELLELVRGWAQGTPPGRWVRAFGYDHLSLIEGRHPTRYELDSAASHHPVRLDHRSGHATVLNSRGLQMAGIDKDTPDPVDGVIDRAEVTGEPTGLLLDGATFLRQRLSPSADPGELEDRIASLSQTLLSYGITSVQDAGPGNDLSRWETFRGLRESGQLMCRTAMMAGIFHLAEFREVGLCWGDGDDRLRLGHSKIMLTLTTGDLQPSVGTLFQMVEQSHREGFPVAIHAVEQEAVAAAVQVLREIPPILTGPAAHSRDRIEHCAECPPELVSEVAECGAMVVTQPGFIYWNGEAYGQRVEPSLLPHLYAVGALDRAGVPLAFGSDAPVTDPNPWPAIYSAVTRATNQCGTLPPRDSIKAVMEQGIAVARALRFYTLGGAWAEGTHDRKGSIRPGKLADLVVLDADPTMVAPSKFKDIRAVLTVVGGRVAWDSGLL